MLTLETCLNQIREWEYCYCQDCDTIRYSRELEATEKGIRCLVCGGYNLESPGWIHCPHQKIGAVKCPRAGKGIIREAYGDDCKFRCSFSKP